MKIAITGGQVEVIRSGLTRALKEQIGPGWAVFVTNTVPANGETLNQQAERLAEEERRAVAEEPEVQVVLKAFPNARVLAVHHGYRSKADDKVVTVDFTKSRR